MRNQVKSEKLTGKNYEVYFLQGNSIAIVSCNEIYFPGQHDFFVTLNGISYPAEELLDTIHVPKHLILQIKTKSKERKSNLVVLNA